MARKPELSGLPALPYLPAAPSKETTLTLRQGVQGVFRGKYLVLTTTLVGVLTGTWMALSRPNVYRSVARFIVTNGGHENVTPDLFLLNPDGSQRTAVNIRGNAIEMLQDDALHRRIVERAGASTVLSPFNPVAQEGDDGGLLGPVRAVVYDLQRWLSGASKPPSNDTASALRTFKGNFRADTKLETDFIELWYTANDPGLAQKIVQAAVVEALARHTETYSHSSLLALTKKDRDEALQESTASVRALEDFKRTHQIENFAMQMTTAETRAGTSEIEAENLDAQIKLNGDRVAVLEEEIKEMPERLSVEQTETVDNPNLPVLRLNIDQMTQQRFRLARTLKEDDQQILKLDENIDQLKKDLEKEEKKPPEIRKKQTFVPNADKLLKVRLLLDTKNRIQDDATRSATFRAARERARKEFGRLAALGTEYHRLERDAAARQVSLNAAARGVAIAEKSIELSVSGISSLRVMQEATKPLDRDGPKRSRIVSGGLLAGLFAGIALLLLKAITDPTVRGPEDLEKALGIKMLAAIPDLRSVHVRRHQSQRVTSWS